MDLERIKYKIRDFLLSIRYWIILKCIGKMPVIVNCTIYDDVMEYNFGKTRTYKACICTNNKIKRFDNVIEKEIRVRSVKDKGITRTRNSFVLTN